MWNEREKKKKKENRKEKDIFYMTCSYVTIMYI